MNDKMTFPETWGEFEKSYGFDDSEEVYTNGSRLIPSFRVKQWLDHAERKQRATGSSDLINRQAVLDLPIKRDICWFDGSVDEWINVEDIKELPSVQPRKGKWIDEKKDSISRLVWGECSICGYDSTIHYYFCPNCGADMREGDEKG